MKNNIFRTFIYTFLFVLSISFFTFPASYTKYDESKLEALKYSSELVVLDKAQDDAIDNVSFDDSLSTATVLFTLFKNKANYMDGVSKDSYEIVVPSSCHASQNLIEFTDTDSVDISLTCNLSNSEIVRDEGDSKAIDFEVLVNERIEDDVIPFRYKKFYVNKEIPEKEVVREKVEEKETVSEDKLKYFQRKIKEIVLAKEKYSNFETEVTNYIDSADLSNGQFELLGIKVEYDALKDEFFYQIDENFLGYARTFDSYNGESSNSVMYFSTDRSEELDSVFEYYLGKYYSLDEKSNYLILNYVKANGGIQEVIYNDGDIPGISKKDLLGIEIDTDIMEYVTLLNTTDEAFIYGGSELQEKKILEAMIRTNEKLSQSIQEQILADENFLEFLSRLYEENGNNTKYFAFGGIDEAVLIEFTLTDSYKAIRFTDLVVEVDDCNLKVKLKFASLNGIDEKYRLDVIGLIEELCQATYVTDSYLEVPDQENVLVQIDFVLDDVQVNDEGIGSVDKGTFDGEDSNSGSFSAPLTDSIDETNVNANVDADTAIRENDTFGSDMIKDVEEKVVEDNKPIIDDDVTDEAKVSDGVG